MAIKSITCIWYVYDTRSCLYCICQPSNTIAYPLSKTLEEERDNYKHTQIITHLQLVGAEMYSFLWFNTQASLVKRPGTKFTHTHTVVPVVQSYRYRVGHLFRLQDDLFLCHVYKSNK